MNSRCPEKTALTNQSRTHPSAYPMRPFRPLSPEPLPLLPEITALLDHPDENTRRNAARAIRKINTLPQ
jgi:hypothetical protein